jgi:hypothetical protein
MVNGEILCKENTKWGAFNLIEEKNTNEYISIEKGQEKSLRFPMRTNLRGS